jgi:hypothetical protein
MSTVPNFAGNFLGNASPFVSNYPAVASPWGTFVKPGGRVAAYVRSTGAQDGEDHFAASGLLVTTINEGLKRCRSGQNDIVFVLPGHTETYSSSGAVWANLVAGAQIIGCGTPGATNNPNITLSNTGASIALNVANVTLAGFNINSATAAVTGAIVVTGAGCTLANNFISFTGALGANAGITVTGVANFTMAGNFVTGTTTLALVNVTGAGSTNLVIAGNMFLQTNASGTSANYVALANTDGISGVVAYNGGKTAASLTTPGTGFLVAGSNINKAVLNIENYCTDADVGTAAVIATGATAA